MMRKIISFIIFVSAFLVLTISINAQTTINTYTVWGTQGTTQDFVLTNGNDLTVNDTLVIYGNLELKNDADITINSGGVLIIVGDFDAKNKVDLAVGGTIVVTGNFSKNGTQGEIVDNGGDVYLFDDDPDWGGDLPDIDYGDEDDIINDPIIDIIGDIINSGCSLTLSLDNIVDVSTVGGNNGAIYITVTGTVDSYSWATNDGSGLVTTDEDQTGLTAGTYSVAVIGTACSVFGSYTVSEVPCTPPTITGTTPASRCGTGTVTLGATASAGTINWYDVETGGTSLATGTTFTTPSISTTTTYWVDATDAGCTTASRTAITATVNPLPTVTLIVDPAFDTICTGNNSRIQINFDLGVGPFDFTVSREDELSIIITDNLSDINTDPYFYEPSPTWEDDGTPETDYFYSITSITDANGCVNNAPQGNVKVTVFKIPETGPQYHISNDWGN